MKIKATRWVLAAVAVLTLADRAGAVEGEFTPETREKLAKLVTIEDEAISLAEFAEEVAEQTGLSFVASAHVAHMPEPVAIFARDVPAGELLDAVAFAMNLKMKITPGGLVAMRFSADDPRREAMIEREFGPDEDRDGEEEPELDEDEIVERVMDNPRVRKIVEKLGGDLDPVKYYPEKRVWVLVVRGDGEREPLARVIATGDGDVIDIKFHDDGWAPKKAKKGKRGKHDKRPDKGNREKEQPFDDVEAREREGLENF